MVGIVFGFEDSLNAINLSPKILSPELSLDVVHESARLSHVVLFHVWNAYVNQRVSKMQRSPPKIYQKYNTSFKFSHFFLSIVSHVCRVSLVKRSCLLPREDWIM